MNSQFLFAILFSFLFLTSCDEEPVCLSNSMLLKENSVKDYPSLNAVKVNFDLTNTAGNDYASDSLTNTIIVSLKVKTTDGTTYDERKYLPYISAGVTKSYDVWGHYGSGKKFKSYSISLSCD